MPLILPKLTYLSIYRLLLVFCLFVASLLLSLFSLLCRESSLLCSLLGSGTLGSLSLGLLPCSLLGSESVSLSLSGGSCSSSGASSRKR